MEQTPPPRHESGRILGRLCKSYGNGIFVSRGFLEAGREEARE